MSAIPAASVTRRLSWKKRLLFVFVTMLLGLAVIEGGSWLLLYFEWGGRQRAAGELRAIANNQPEDPLIAVRFEVNHPYLGYVMHVNNDDYQVQGVDPFPVTDYGFYDSAGPLRHRAPDKVIVGITGGSVAHEFSVLSSDVLAETLRARFPDQEIEFVRLALPGYKQPQQLMTLTYVLALGGELDLLINIDGFNEVALPESENVDYNVFSAFPRAWRLRVVTGNDVPLMRAIGYATFCREKRRELAESFYPFRWSTTAVLIWRSQSAAIERRLAQVLREIEALNALDDGFCARGPAEDFPSQAAMYDRFAEIWADGSLQMHRLCRANGIEYYHFLQPTRNFPEVDHAEPTLAECVQRGYPRLQRRGRVLLEQGVAFVDLTDTFEPLQQGIYTDTCHLNKSSNDRMAERIGNRIIGETAAE